MDKVFDLIKKEQKRQEETLLTIAKEVKELCKKLWKAKKGL